MALDFLAAVRENARVAHENAENYEKEVESFDLIPETDRREDLEISTLLNE